MPAPEASQAIAGPALEYEISSYTNPCIVIASREDLLDIEGDDGARAALNLLMLDISHGPDPRPARDSRDTERQLLDAYILRCGRRRGRADEQANENERDPN